MIVKRDQYNQFACAIARFCNKPLNLYGNKINLIQTNKQKLFMPIFVSINIIRYNLYDKYSHPLVVCQLETSASQSHQIHSIDFQRRLVACNRNNNRSSSSNTHNAASVELRKSSVDKCDRLVDSVGVLLLLLYAVTLLLDVGAHSFKCI